MDFSALQRFIAHRWQDDLLPVLSDYIAIPCQSPAFEPDWAERGHMQRAVTLMIDWARERLAQVPGARVEVVTLAGRTPVIYIEIPGEGTAPVLIYGHLDKQPPMTGWTHGRDAWTPSLEGERLYGRGGADDGYAIFAAILAIQALRAQGLTHAPCAILIEACEESGSGDLPYYVEHLAPRMGSPAVVVALDAGCGNYEQLWLTTSLRGQVAGALSVRVLEEGVHSGDASGVVASSFRIARMLLSRLEDPGSGEIASPFHAPIPPSRRAQARIAARALGDGLHAQLPLHPGMRPVHADAAEVLLNRAWRPQLAITGLDGLPAVADAAAVMQPATTLKLSLRLPPTLDAQAAAGRLKALLESEPPYGSEVAFRIDMVSQGWHAPETAPWLSASLERASQASFGAGLALIGGGGGIPFLAMLGERFPSAQFVVTGVLGPQSNAHGPNEFLHLPTAQRITAVVAQLLHDARLAHADGPASQPRV
ncbi:peptidase M20 [Lysobacter sp. Root916]|uniref:M20/M25/M40 family metallo-hydrolase n=1 Tax=Lysobacter sp. Root916 TaxID=1736606 RepID=UPI0007091AE1|nr:M20/M25/M40 family metallo-hydrolase [Lysobacter sp. Root916]KRD39422.1 peptidase M20 [Lysobacter sp. Root916]